MIKLTFGTHDKLKTYCITKQYKQLTFNCLTNINMDYTTCETFTNFLQKYPFVQPKDLFKFIYDIHSVKHENVHYNADILTKYKLIELRKIASQFKIKQNYKMDKKEIIDAILKYRILYQIHLHVILY